MAPSKLTMDSARVYTNFSEVPSYTSDSEERQSSVFSTIDWFDLLWRTIRSNKQVLRLYTVPSPTGQQTIIPMWHSASQSVFQAKKLLSLANFYTPLFSPIASGITYDGDLWSAFARRLKDERPKWDSVNIHPLPLEANTLTKIRESFESAGMLVQTYFCFGNWYLPVNFSSYQEYLQTRPSRLRNTLQRKRQQLLKMHRFEFRMVQNENELDVAVADYETIYSASWKPPEAFPDFIPQFIRLMAIRRQLRLGIAYIDGKPAAAQFWIKDSQVAAIYKLAYDPQFAAHSIGTLLTEKMMEYAIDVDHVAEIDYLMGDDQYKKDWMSHRRERWGIMALNPRTINGIALIVRHIGAQRLKRLLHIVIGRFKK